MPAKCKCPIQLYAEISGPILLCFFSDGSMHSWPISDQLNRWALRTSLVSKRSHSPHRRNPEWRLAHSHWMPASHSNGPLTDTFGHCSRWVFPIRRNTLLELPYTSGSDDMLHGLLSGFSDARQERIIFRRLFVPAARILLKTLQIRHPLFSVNDNYRWDTKYCENTSGFRIFILRTSAKSLGISLPRKAWV